MPFLSQNLWCDVLGVFLFKCLQTHFVNSYPVISVIDDPEKNTFFLAFWIFLRIFQAIQGKRGY